MGGQAVLMSFAIGFFRVPTEANVFYSCRGLWAILLVAWLGKHMGLPPKATPPEPLKSAGSLVQACSS